VEISQAITLKASLRFHEHKAEIRLLAFWRTKQRRLNPSLDSLPSLEPSAGTTFRRTESQLCSGLLLPASIYEPTLRSYFLKKYISFYNPVFKSNTFSGAGDGPHA
jgi:hypothetical protein